MRYLEWINATLDNAKARHDLPSDRQLALKLQLTPTTISQIRRGKVLPGDDSMASIADVAGLDRGECLIRLNYWRAVNGPAKRTYRNLLKKMGYAASIGAVVLPMQFSKPAQAVQSEVTNIYIMRRRRIAGGLQIRKDSGS